MGISCCSLLLKYEDIAVNYRIEKYGVDNIHTIASTSYTNGFVVVIIPSGCPTLETFAMNSLSYERILDNPIVGYVSGYDLNITGQSAKVISGTNLETLSDGAVALHIELPNNMTARVEIINPNTINTESPIFVFPESSFVQSECLINGQKAYLADYLVSIKHPTNGLPLMANYNGALINRDVMQINAKEGFVSFFAPLFSDEEYQFAKPITDYLEAFQRVLQIDRSKALYSCLCVSFYLLGNLENKKVNVDGPFTFGEIAYQLLNQTAVYLVID